MSTTSTSANTVLHGTGGAGIIPVVVRFIPYDQWCTTHIALSWTITQVKTWILAKCFHDSDTLRILSVSLNAAARSKGKSRPKRSVSPIAFASVRMNKDKYAGSWDDIRLQSFDELDDDEDNDAPYLCDSDDNRSQAYSDRPPRSSNPYIAHSKSAENTFFPPPSNIPSRPSMSSQKSISTTHPDDYSLLTFSTLHILEDRYQVSWCNIRPHELLELHPSGTIVHLSRNVSFNNSMNYVTPNTKTRPVGNDALSGLSRDGHASFEHTSVFSDYIQPYFQAPVKALRVVRHDTRLSTQGSQVPSPTQEDAPQSASAPPSYSKAGRLLKPNRPSNAHDINLAPSTSREAVTFDPTVTSPDLTNSKKDISATGDPNSSKAYVLQLPGAKRRGIGSSDAGRTKLVWQDRWIVIREGVLSLCEKKEDIKNPSHLSPMTSLVALRGVEHLTTNASLANLMAGSSRRNDVSMKKRIVCAKFQTQQDTGKRESSVGPTEREPDDSEGKGRRTFIGQDDHRTRPYSSSDIGGQKKEDAIWLILDMLNEAAFDNVVRVLHQLAPNHVVSTFLDEGRRGSSSSPFSSFTNGSQTSIHNRSSFSSLRQSSYATSSGSEQLEPLVRSASQSKSLSTAMSPESPYFGLSIDTSSQTLGSPRRHYGTHKRSYEGLKAASNTKYPDWRINTLIRAQRAGLGDVGKAMQLLIWGDIEDEEAVENKTAKQSTGFKTPKAIQGQKFSSDIVETNGEAEQVDMSADGTSESDSWDDGDSDDLSSEEWLSENEWEGWQQDVTRQWTSIAEEPEFDYSSIQQVRFSDYRLKGGESGRPRRRVYSEVQKLVPQPPSTDLPAVITERGDSAPWPQLLQMPGTVTTTTVSVGRSTGRQRSSTVTGSPSPKMEQKEKKITKSKGKEKEKEKSRVPLWRSRPSSLQPPISKQEEVAEVSTVTGNGTAKTIPRSRPTSILRRHSAVDPDIPDSSNANQVANQQSSVAPNRVLPGENNNPQGGDTVRSKSKRKVPSLNGLVRGVSTRASAVKSRAKGVL